ncbi:hypothetical protein [Azohydromonas lata]|uniref:Uncharacterized protein n=1 Tax=Azohydromonas lata TaxID=45677 RepID=A0ABU5IAJ1_9BURK|nr:hypothetical protein [Azohydromonas lata]MDZ5455670.1 hypothetical protein [Azohydromonas lata]
MRSKGRAAAVGGDAQRMLERMKALGLPGTEAKRLAARYPAQSILDAFRYTETRQADAKQALLEQPAAYFRKALEQGYGRREDQAPQAPSRKSISTSRPSLSSIGARRPVPTSAS